jgi:ATP/maltotriose-dependent transcriptional regulator MalT
MDQEDRNWVSFLSYLVAAGRQHDPGFAPRTSAMLQEIDQSGTTRDEVLEVFLPEFSQIAGGAAFILDDFHVADESADVRFIAQELVAKAPPRLTFVFSSRRRPGIRTGRLRALGELAELGTGDLRFSEDETSDLFRDAYGRPLEQDVMADLTRRTEGWAASLQLVQAALRERSVSETRAFIRQLSGAQAELYDYLAEEVVGDLPRGQQQFLMATSLLQVVTLDAARVVSGGSDKAKVHAFIDESERLGLL